MDPTERVIGINCFNEFLSFGDFMAYVQKNFPKNEYSQLNKLDLVFYSKRLNLFVNKGCIVHYLNNYDPLEIVNGHI